MKKKIAIICCITLGIIFALYISKNQVKELEINYKDTFPKIKMYTHDGKETDKLYTSKKKYVFYLSNSCSACVEKLEAIEKIVSIYHDEEIDYLILWEGNIPIKKIKAYDIDINKNLSITKYKLKGTVPQFLILDEKQIIKFAIKSDFGSFYKRIEKDVGEKNVELITQRAIKYLNKKSNGKDKKIMAIFNDDDDFDKELNELLKDNRSDLIINIKREKNGDEESIGDYEGILRNIFNVEGSPTVIVFKNQEVNKVLVGMEEIDVHINSGK